MIEAVCFDSAFCTIVFKGGRDITTGLTERQSAIMSNIPHPPRLFSVGYISPKDEPIFVQAFSITRNPSRSPDDLLKANYVANCALDVFDEREKANPKATECYLGLLYPMDGLSVYGYITPTKMKIVTAFTQSEATVKDSEVIMVCTVI